MIACSDHADYKVQFKFSFSSHFGKRSQKKKIPLLIRALRLQNGSSADAKRVYRSPVGSSLSATSSPDIAKLKNKEQLEPLLESWTPPA